MRVLLFIFAGIAFLGGLGTLGDAQSAIQEIKAFMLFLTAAVFFSGAAIVQSLILMRKTLEALMKNPDIE